MEAKSRRSKPLKKKVTEWVAWLIGKGHIHAYSYGINFLQIAIKEAYLQGNENTANIAIAGRISQLAPKDYSKAVDGLIEVDTPPVNHKENLKRFGKK